MVFPLLAVVLQVGDVMVESVGVVAAAFTPNQPFGVTRRRCSITAVLHVPTLGCVRVLGPGPAAALHAVHHHHLAGAVSAQVLHKLLLVLSLEVTRLAEERLLLLGALADFGRVLLGGFTAGKGTGCSPRR